MTFDVDYEICFDQSTFYQESTVVRVKLQTQQRCLQLRDGNPTIQLPAGLSDGAHSTGDSTSYVISMPDFAMAPVDDETYPSLYWTSYQAGDEFRLATTIDAPSCSQISMKSRPPMVYARAPNSDEALLFDPRVVFQENTVENPIPDGGGSVVLETNSLVNCANAPRTFLNEDHCVLSTSETACRANESIEIEVELSEEFIKAANQLAGRYIYAVDNVPINDETYRDDEKNLRYYSEPPCALQSLSRWMRVDANTCQVANYRTAGAQTETTFGNLLKNVAGSSVSLLEDVLFFRGLQCDVADEGKRSLGLIRDADGQCWQHVNRRHLNVYDMTDFVAHHPGGTEPIMRWANQGLARIMLPDSHQEVGNARLQQMIRRSTFLGKLGSTVALPDVPRNIQTDGILNQFGIFPQNPTGAGVVVCGSVGEVSNEAGLGTGYFIESFERGSARQGLPTKPFLQGQKVGIWAQIALTSLDQVRQRVAFALSQILVVSPQLLGGQEGTESTLSFYDIFVRHAFGNYRDVLKEVSFHPKMGEMLSSLNSKSFQYLEDRGEEAYPDENFAREIMQLFSIGLYRLNLNGTVQLDEDGEPLATYDNSDILSFARVWTGMNQQERRGNYEHGPSRVDPMAVDERWHDIFPKSDLNGGYIGDGYPLCIDMPVKHFLKKGATYRLLGSRSSPELQEDLTSWDTDSEIQRLTLDSSSPLFEQLCGAQSLSLGCSFPGKVTLQTDLDYSSFQDADELMVDTLRTVQVQSEPTPIYYEYVEPACVNHVFFNNAKRVVGGVRRTGEVRSMMCADPRHAVALENCCNEASVENNPVPFGNMNCKYNGERMSFQTNVQRCNSIGLVDCDLSRLVPQRAGICSKDIDKLQMRRLLAYRWSRGSCSILAKITSNGNIAIVHDPEPDLQGGQTIQSGLHEGSRNFFKVSWDNKQFPSVATGCDDISDHCTISGQFCICETSVQEMPAFQSANAFNSDVDMIRSKLFHGALDPQYLSSTHVSRGNCNGRLGRVQIYTTTATSCENFDENTIFALLDPFNRVSYWKNIVSTVSIGGAYSFRNPVSFSNFVKPTLRDAYVEMDAAIDHYLHHPSHPPFLATRMLQRFGFSNPSPRLVSVVAEAYQRGNFESFGTGMYGDLKAMVAAILLDPESTSVSIDSDPTHGQLREPLLKVFAFLRAMNYDHNSPRLWPILTNLQEQIGEGIYQTPDVFSFFPPDFVPAGKLSSATLFSPESQILNAGTVTGLLDGIYTTTKYGMVPQLCYSGLGGEKPKGARRCPLRRRLGEYTHSMGNLTYVPTTSTAEDIIDELAVLLTADRLQQSHRQRISQEIEPFVFRDPEKALRLAQQLVVSSPEFHATNSVRSSGLQQKIEPPSTQKSDDYKVVVYLMLTGGMDSFNLLVPTGGCNSTDLYEHYRQVRGNAALDRSDLESITTSGQHCSEFGVNNRFSLLKELYAEGDTMFFANIGTLDKPVTKTDWLQNTRTSLFAHNIQQQELMRLDIGKELDLSGVGGRMMDVLKDLGYQTSSNSVASAKALATGSPTKGNHVKTLPRNRPSVFNVVPETENMDQLLMDLNSQGQTDSSLFAEQWSSNLVQGIAETRLTVDIFNQYETIADFPSDAISGKFESAATWIKSREERNVERELIFIQHPGWDHHDISELNNLETKLAELNGALSAFVGDMKEQNMWDNVVIMSGSDFGRTLTPNSRGGTDHAWAGNNFMMGGGIKGGIIHGEYPIDLSENGDFNIGRGRLIPTLPNEAPWQAVAQWMGVTESQDLDYMLPNRKSFDACSLFTDEQLFQSGSVVTTCGNIIKDDNTDGNVNDSDGDLDNVDSDGDLDNVDSDSGSNGNGDNSINVIKDNDGDSDNVEFNDRVDNDGSKTDDVSGSTTIWRLGAVAGSGIITIILAVT